jgi:hypothetical protein
MYIAIIATKCSFKMLFFNFREINPNWWHHFNAAFSAFVGHFSVHWQGKQAMFQSPEICPHFPHFCIFPHRVPTYSPPPSVSEFKGRERQGMPCWESKRGLFSQVLRTECHALQAQPSGGVNRVPRPYWYPMDTPLIH